MTDVVFCWHYSARKWRGAWPDMCLCCDECWAARERMTCAKVPEVPQMLERIYDHAPAPGPLYWDFRCTRCSQPCAQHAGFFARLLWRIRGRRA